MRSSKHLFEDLGAKSTEEAITYRQDTMTIFREEAHKYIDSMEGSFAIVNVIFEDNEDLLEATAGSSFVRVLGNVHDMSMLIASLKEAATNVLKTGLDELSIEEKIHLAAHVVEDFKKGEK